MQSGGTISAEWRTNLAARFIVATSTNTYYSVGRRLSLVAVGIMSAIHSVVQSVHELRWNEINNAKIQELHRFFATKIWSEKYDTWRPGLIIWYTLCSEFERVCVSDEIQNMSVNILYDFMFYSIRLQDWEKEAIRPNGVLKYFSGLFYEAFTHTKEMKRIEAGFLLKEILNRFTSKSRSLLQPNRKLWIYSAHDLTIANVLNALNVFEDVTIFFYSHSISSHDQYVFIYLTGAHSSLCVQHVFWALQTWLRVFCSVFLQKNTNRSGASIENFEVWIPLSIGTALRNF